MIDRLTLTSPKYREGTCSCGAVRCKVWVPGGSVTSWWSADCGMVPFTGVQPQQAKRRHHSGKAVTLNIDDFLEYAETTDKQPRLSRQHVS